MGDLGRRPRHLGDDKAASLIARQVRLMLVDLLNLTAGRYKISPRDYTFYEFLVQSADFARPSTFVRVYRILTKSRNPIDLFFGVLIFPITVVGMLPVTVIMAVTSALLRKTVTRPAAVRLMNPPGFMLLRLAEFLYSKRTFQEVLAPTIWDLQEEYNEALADGRPWKARWVRIRGTWSFLAAVGLHRLVSLGKAIHSMWKLVP